MEYVKEAYETNWMSTVGKNINKVEKPTAEQAGVNMQLLYQLEPHHCILQ